MDTAMIALCAGLTVLAIINDLVIRRQQKLIEQLQKAIVNKH